MSDCRIFKAISAAKLIEEEVEALVDELQSAIKLTGITIKAPKWNTVESLCWTWEILVQLPRLKAGRKLSVWFDLTRPTQEAAGNPAWEHAKEALIVVGYDPKPNRGWDATYLSVTDAGRLQDDHAWTNCCRSMFAGRRLLEWKAERVGDAWWQRAWAFAVPLRRIDAPKAVHEQLAQPIAALLLEGSKPHGALQSVHAIRWSVPNG